MLWLVAALLVAVALAFSVWPLLKAQAPVRSVASRRTLMRALYRDRVAELEREAAAGQLDPETRTAVVEELGANLLDEFRQAKAQADAEGASDAAPTTSRPGLALWLLLLLLPVGGVAVYLSAGEPDATLVAGADEVLRLDPDTRRADIEDWRDRLARRVTTSPEDGQSWYLLGISRLQLGEFAAAADAFASARQRVGSDPNIDLYWLQARYLADGGTLDDRSRAIAREILEARPNHPLVLEMYAIDAYRAGDYRQAVEQLNRALNNPLPSGQLETLLSGLAQARSRMEPLSPSVDVRVPAPAGVPAGATVFVIARPPGGGMPYAVVRRPAGLLPLDVRLDDTVSMSEAQQLSDADAFEVVVRVSRSGNPTPAPGDWEWRSDVLETAALSEPVALEARLAPRTAPAAAAGSPRSPAVDVNISAPAGAPRDATLFVFARQPGGRMPLAAVRRSAAELPLQVRLDDGASMAGQKLSDADRFEVVVRLSVSGSVTAGPGDWEWRSDVLETASLAEPVALEARLAPRQPD